MNTPFDHRQIRRAFSRSAASYDAAAALQREAGARLRESLDYLGARKPGMVLDAQVTGEREPLSDRLLQPMYSFGGWLGGR